MSGQACEGPKIRCAQCPSCSQSSTPGMTTVRRGPNKRSPTERPNNKTIKRAKQKPNTEQCETIPTAIPGNAAEESQRVRAEAPRFQYAQRRNHISPQDSRRPATYMLPDSCAPEFAGYAKNIGPNTTRRPFFWASTQYVNSHRPPGPPSRALNPLDVYNNPLLESYKRYVN